jgi:ATPase involved in DNA repair
MLTRLSIRNIVLIEALDLDFARGLGVLTGETGAGKSILLDALGLVLGDRAETSLVRAGEDKASVTASFEFAALPGAIAAALDDADIDIEPGEPLIIRRQVKADGGSKAFIDDVPASVALLRELAPALAELHGQHDDRGLVNPRTATARCSIVMREPMSQGSNGPLPTGRGPRRNWPRRGPKSNRPGPIRIC